MALRLTRALSHRNYRLFFYGQSVSLVGTWITRVAVSWLVYRLTGSELLLGIVGFAGQIPTLLLGPLAGVIVDRHNRHRMLIWTQAASLVQSVLLAVLTLADVITVPHLVLLQLLQGVINAFDTPARQTLVVEMVTNRSDVPNAIALNSSMVNGSRVIGPAIGGVIIAAVGEGWCFAIDAVSYVGVIVSLLLMRLEPRPHDARALPMLDDLRSGFQYVRDSVPIRSGLVLLAIISTAGVPYTVLMPAVVDETFGGGPDLLGWLMGAIGIGALAGALYLANRETVVGLGRVILIGALSFGAGLVIFSMTSSIWLAAPTLAVAGAGFIVQAASTNTIIQTIVDERFRGRVMAFYTMAFFGSVPVGSLISGVVATYIGATATIRVGGLVCIVAGLWFAMRLPVLRAAVRPIYISRGIIAPPDVDPGGTAG